MQELKWYDPNDENSPWIKALAEVRHLAPREGWCFVPGEHLVAGDVMLAQKIALETDERGALEKANRFTPR
jgi:hypothetical protein